MLSYRDHGLIPMPDLVRELSVIAPGQDIPGYRYLMDLARSNRLGAGVVKGENGRYNVMRASLPDIARSLKLEIKLGDGHGWDGYPPAHGQAGWHWLIIHSRPFPAHWTGTGWEFASPEVGFVLPNDMRDSQYLCALPEPTIRAA